MKGRRLSTWGIILAVTIFLGVLTAEEASGHGRGRRGYYFSYPSFPPPPKVTRFCPPGIYKGPRYVWPYPRRLYDRRLPKPPRSQRYDNEFPLSHLGYFNAEGVWIPFTDTRNFPGR